MPSLATTALRRLAPRTPRHLRTERLRLADGARTTLYAASYDPRRTDVRVVVLPRPQPLEAWCRSNAEQEALVGGFYARPHGTPLGELRTGGMLREHVPFASPHGALRACLHVQGGRPAIARRDTLPAAPAGDLLQAGPLLVQGGRTVAGDDEGFSAGSHQFDSDITDGRYPRAAIGLRDDGTVLAVACDGRADDDAGLTMPELAEAMVALGAVQAMNLDGGGSTSLICGGRLRNRPRESHGLVLDGGRAVSTAVVFRAR